VRPDEANPSERRNSTEDELTSLRGAGTLNSEVVGRRGELVVVEVTGAFNQYARGHRIEEKAATWAAIGGHTHLDLHVVFVDITGRGHRDE
jgi:hypothetical protein